MKFLVLLFFVTACCKHCPESNKIYKEIDKVGGCDKNGYCGVRFTDGSFETDVYQPVEGKQVYKGCRK